LDKSLKSIIESEATKIAHDIIKELKTGLGFVGGWFKLPLDEPTS